MANRQRRLFSLFLFFTTSIRVLKTRDKKERERRRKGEAEMANRQRQDRIESRSEIFAISYVSTAFSFFFFSPPLSAFWKRKRKRKGRRKREGKRKRNGKLEMANRQRRDRIESRKYLLFLTCPQFLPLFLFFAISIRILKKQEREREREKERGRKREAKMASRQRRNRIESRSEIRPVNETTIFATTKLPNG